MIGIVHVWVLVVRRSGLAGPKELRYSDSSLLASMGWDGKASLCVLFHQRPAKNIQMKSREMLLDSTGVLALNVVESLL